MRAPLARIALVLGVVAGVLGFIEAPVQLAVQAAVGLASASWLSLVFAVPAFVLAVVALVLGIVSARGHRPVLAIEGAAIGLAAFLVLGQLSWAVSLVVVQL